MQQRHNKSIKRTWLENQTFGRFWYKDTARRTITQHVEIDKGIILESF